jgi:alanyl-tRNA synthetase
VALFKEEGFHRKRCKSCGRIFWTLDEGRETCGGTPCDEYSFIGNPPIRKAHTLKEMEGKFLKFFERRGHTVIKRYPVVARWRDDIFLTIASIANFQPWVTSGQVPPPANPLVVSQPSIRLKDIDNVGRSGRHFTLFFMGGHHAFNSRQKRVYWNDETVAYCHEFMVEELGIPADEISYIQDIWEGGGNAGEDFEVTVRGLELATLVFMHYAGQGGKYSPLPLKIVDTGYGMERLTWASQGTPSSYEAVFGPVVKRYRELAGVEMPPEEILAEHSRMAGLIDIETGHDLLELRKKVASATGMSVEDLDKLLSPLEAVYAIADHLRCLAFMFCDGITPSNVQAGYLARLVLRRTLRLMRELRLEHSPVELMSVMLEHLTPQFPEFKERASYILEVVGLEEQRYRESISRGERLVERLIAAAQAENKGISSEKLIELYDSHGLPPEIVKEVATKLGARVEIPENFYIRVAELHSSAKGGEIKAGGPPEAEFKGLAPTKAIYYDDPYAKEFEAKVLKSFGNFVVLDRTAFYPEGGGQPGDIGTLSNKSGTAEVVNVQKVGGVVIHEVKPNLFKKGQRVQGKIDWERRGSLMRHHTATHVLIGAARRVLGNHVWQHGVQKGVESTRLDISHFKRIEPHELREIERLANEVVVENRPVNIRWMERNEAEQKYGFDLYQGGVVPGRVIRIVDIEGWNTQACAGTHCTRTGEIGLIKIIRTERIQDGVERLEFAAGGAAVKFVQRQSECISSVAEILRSTPEQIPEATKQLFESWKSAQKETERLRQRLAEMSLVGLKLKAKKVGNVSVVCEEVEGVGPEDLIKIADSLVKHDGSMVAVLASREEGRANLVAMAGQEAIRAGINAGRIAAEAAKELAGGGGGRADLGQGGGTNVGGIGEALKKAFKFVEQQMGQG